jgi:hypothetical protein
MVLDMWTYYVQEKVSILLINQIHKNEFEVSFHIHQRTTICAHLGSFETVYTIDIFSFTLIIFQRIQKMMILEK